MSRERGFLPGSGNRIQEVAPITVGMALFAMALGIAGVATRSRMQVALAMATLVIASLSVAMLVLLFLERRRTNTKPDRSSQDESSDLLWNASRELSPPAARILGLAATIDDVGSDISTNQVTRLYSKILDEAFHLSQVMDEISDFAKLERGETSFRPQPCSLIEEVSGVLEAFRSSNPRTINTHIPSELRIEADPRALRRILEGLIVNTEACSEPGSVLVIRARAAKKEIIVSVDLTCSDMTETAQAKIFKPFSGIDPHQRLGIGMALSKGLAEAQHGRMWAESAPGRGITLSFALPRAA